MNRGFALAVMILAASPSQAQTPARQSPNNGERYRVEVQIRRWRSDLVSELELSSGGLAGTPLDPFEDLGLQNERIFDYHFGVRVMGRVKLRGSWMKVKYEGEKGVESDLCVAGLCVPTGTSVTSTLELEETRGGAEVDLLQGTYGFLAIAGEYGRFEARPSFESGTASTGEQLTIDFPLFGLKGRAYLTPALALTVEGMGWKNESEGVWTDFDASATYSAGRNFGISYGYRNAYWRFKSIEPLGDRAVMRVRGQYLAVTVRF
ncbi:MAG TPA: hypothetical protein VIG29_13570 [Vicinamibacteria bacterium]